MRRYFEMEDPREITVLGVELRVSAETADGVTIRGIIDRLELDADGELVVTDYKTGREPGRGLGAEEHGRRPHLLAAVRADVRPPPEAHAAALPVASPSGSSPSRPTRRARASR